MKLRRNVLTSTLVAFISLLLFNIDAPKAEEFHVTTAAEFQRALTAVRDNGEVNTILLAAGTYKASDNNHDFMCAMNSDLTIKGELGTTSDDVIIDLDDDFSLFFERYNGYISVTIEGTTVRNGSGMTFYGDSTGDIVLRNNKIINNSSAVDIMYHTENRVDIILVGNTIEGNYCGGVRISYSGDITIENNIISGNTSCCYGGGIYIKESGSIYLNNNTISENKTVYVDSNSCKCPPCTGGVYGGGGIWITDSGDVTLTNNTITGNSAQRDGVGGYFITSGDCTVINNIISDNYRSSSSPGPTGGACFIGGNIIKVINNTITRNDVPGAEGLIINGRTVYVYNNIIWGNIGDELNNESSINDSTYVYNNILGHVIGLTFFTEDVNNVDEDPLLTDDYHLLPDSPCIDKGNANAPELPATDFEDDSRIIGGVPDIGADEFDPSAPPTTTSTTTSATTTIPIGTTTTTTTSSSGGSCLSELIYGEQSEETELLRYFRDNVLRQTSEGQEMIKLYYQWSPAIVKAMEGDEEFKEEIKEMIDGVLSLIKGEAG